MVAFETGTVDTEWWSAKICYQDVLATDTTS